VKPTPTKGNVAMVLETLECVLKSITQKPTLIENNKLYQYYGLSNQAVIVIKDIASIESSTRTVGFDNQTRKLSP
jgi:hypothetical protein